MFRQVEGEAHFSADGFEHIGFRLEDGSIITEFSGCDHREDPTPIFVALAKMLRDNDQIVEIFDGSDALWFGIIRYTR